MKRIGWRWVGLLTVYCLILVITPARILAQAYGSGTYGGGAYNVGDGAPTSTPGSTSSSSSNSSGTSTPSAPGCNNSSPTGSPNLFEVRTTKSTATLYFAPASMPYSSYYVAYSRKSDAWEYGVEFNQGYSGGVLNYTINMLSPNTKYYFKVRAGNGCATGNFGNTMIAKTTSSTQKKVYYKNFLTAVIQTAKSWISSLGTPGKTVLVTPQVTATPQNETVPTAAPRQQPITTTPTPVKNKFCILWWCF